MKVYLLFEAWGNGDSFVEYDFVSVHKTRLGALDRAKDFFLHYEQHDSDFPRTDKGLKECMEITMEFSDSYMRFCGERDTHRAYIESAVGFLYYGDFGGFVIEETDVI